MSNVRRVYVEKKGSYDVQQKALAHEIRNYLGIKDVEYVRILNRYDVENVSDETFERACNGIFAEPPVDVLWKEEAPVGSGDSLFSVEFLPGQFDQRADSAVQCIQFVKRTSSRSSVLQRLILFMVRMELLQKKNFRRLRNTASTR